MSRTEENKGLHVSVKEEIANFLERHMSVEREEYNKLSGVLTLLGMADVEYMKIVNDTWNEGLAETMGESIIDAGINSIYEILLADIKVNHPTIIDCDHEDLVVEELLKQVQKAYEEDKKEMRKVIYEGGTVISIERAYLDHIDDVLKVLPLNVFTDYLLDEDFSTFSLGVEDVYDALKYNAKRGEEYFRLMYVIQKDPRIENYRIEDSPIAVSRELQPLIKGYMFSKQRIHTMVDTTIQGLETRKSATEYYDILSRWDGSKIPVPGEKDFGKMHLGCYAYKYNRYGEKRQPTKALEDTIKMVIRLKMRFDNVSTAQANECYKRLAYDLVTKGVAILPVNGKIVLIGKVLVVFAGQGETLQVAYRESHSNVKERDLRRLFG